MESYELNCEVGKIHNINDNVNYMNRVKFAVKL